MTTALRSLPVLPWLVAFAGTFVAGCLAFAAFLPAVALAEHMGWANPSWIAKVCTTPFVTTALVLAAYRLAPSHKRVFVSLAVAVAVRWAGSFLYHGLDSPSPYLTLMGVTGLAGAFGSAAWAAHLLNEHAD